MQLPILLIFLTFSTLAYSHGGGLDDHGGHWNRKTGEYHCHREPCTTVHRQTEAATREAEAEGRALSRIYRREDWRHWTDADGDCMNARHEALLAQATGPVKLSPDGCYVSVGQWIGPYSGKTYTRASDLDVDHIIPLKWAHEHGGANWPADRKERFANDPDNLLVVDDGLNQSKGAKGPTEWMPPLHAYRCNYLDRWAGVLKKYPDLRMTAAEGRIFSRMRSACLSR